MKVTCPCCAGHGVIKAGPPVRLTPTQRAIYEIVRSSPEGVPLPRLADAVYADRADGGPDSAFDCIRTTVYKMNQRLREVGERVAASDMRYQLRKVA